MEEEKKPHVDNRAVARAKLFQRQRAYVQTFDTGSEANLEVLRDLARFCRANKSTFNADPRVHAVLEGRREVWLRIQQHLKLDSETLWKIYGEGAQI
jgi:hypothetical protein